MAGKIPLTGKQEVRSIRFDSAVLTACNNAVSSAKAKKVLNGGKAREVNNVAFINYIITEYFDPACKDFLKLSSKEIREIKEQIKQQIAA